MLVKAAKALSIPPASLLPEELGSDTGAPAVLGLVAGISGAEELIETYARIPSPRLRRAVLKLARALAERDGGPSEDADD